jgi:hypothetical protein
MPGHVQVNILGFGNPKGAASLFELLLNAQDFDLVILRACFYERRRFRSKKAGFDIYEELSEVGEAICLVRVC